METVLIVVVGWVLLNVAFFAVVELRASIEARARRRAGTPGAATVARPDGLQPH